MNRRGTVAILVTSIVAMAACGGARAPSTEAEAAAKITSGSSINLTTARYRVPGVDVRLVKVVRLPAGTIGMRFDLHPTSRSVAECCTFFPRLALSGSRRTGARENFGQVDVVERASSFSDGTLRMLLVAGSPSRMPLGEFTVDLGELGITGVAG